MITAFHYSKKWNKKQTKKTTKKTHRELLALSYGTEVFWFILLIELAQ